MKKQRLKEKILFLLKRNQTNFHLKNHLTIVQNLALNQKVLILQILHLPQMIMRKENLLNKEQQEDLKRIKIKEM